MDLKRFTHEAWVVAGFDRPLTARARLYNKSSPFPCGPERFYECKFTGLVANEKDLGKRFDDEIVSPKGAIFSEKL
jgi:hypothetical protein